MPDADPCLAGRERVIASDSVVLDECASWINLAQRILEKVWEDSRGEVREFAGEFAGRVKAGFADRPGMWIVDLDPDPRRGD